jgi:hypothetical protein
MYAHFAFLSASVDVPIEQVPAWMIYVFLTAAAVGVAGLALLFYFLLRNRK